MLIGALLRAWVLIEHGQVEEGITQIRQTLATVRAIGVEQLAPYWLLVLAEAHGKGEQPDEGLRALAEALALVEKNEERLYEAELYRLYGELSLRVGEAEMGRTGDQKFLADSPFPRFSVSSSEECFLKAIDIARRQQAKMWELRATVSLARLWQRQGRRHEAHNMLSEIYDWFTEGFDTMDLKEARALLEELA